MPIGLWHPHTRISLNAFLSETSGTYILTATGAFWKQKHFEITTNQCELIKNKCGTIEQWVYC